MSPLPAFLLVGRHTLLRLWRSRRILLPGLVCLLPVVLAYLQIRYAQQHERGVAHAYIDDFALDILIFTLQIAVPFSALVLGAAVLGEEVEHRTVTYLFTRPVRRAVVFCGRLAGYAAGFGVFVALSTLATCSLLAGPASLGAREIWGTVGVACAGYLVYLAIFALLGAWTRRALLVGFLAILFEGFVSKLPGATLSKVSVWHHLALLFSRLFPAGRIGSDLLLGLEPQESVASSAWVLVGIFLVALGAAIWLVERREVRVSGAVAGS